MADTHAAVGEVIDERYVVLEPIGSGGMGSVYKARQIGLERLAAIKLLHAGLITNHDSLSRFEREGKIISSLSHKHIITFYSFGVWKERYPYIAMEYLEGSSLRDVLVREGKLGWERTIKIGLQICDAMEYSVQHGIINRDLNPNNIMLLAEPEPDFVKIIDFGLAKLVADGRESDQKLTQTGALIGTVLYLSPEQCRGMPADQRSDIYSLGCVLYECIAGQPPITADNPIGILHKHVHEMPELLKECLKNETLPNGLDAVLFKAIAKEPGDRYQSMQEFASDLGLVRDHHGDQVTAKPVRGKNELSWFKRTENRRLLAGTSKIAALIMLAASFLYVVSDPGLAEPVAAYFKDQDFDESLRGSLGAGEWCLAHNRRKGAKIFLLQAYQLSREKGLKNLKQAALLSQLADLCLTDGEVRLSQRLGEEALALILQLKLDSEPNLNHLEADKVMRRTLTVLTQSGVQSSSKLSRIINLLSNHYYKDKDQQNVYALAIMNLEMQIRTLGPNSHSSELAVAYRKLLGAYILSGNLKQSEYCSKKEIEILTQSGESKSQLSNAWSGLGDTYRSEGRLAEAEKCYRKALSLCPEFIEEEIFAFLDSHEKLLDVLALTKRRKEATALLEEVLNTAKNADISPHSRAMLYGDVGRYYQKLGLDAQAEKAWFKSLEVFPTDATDSIGRYAMTSGWLSDFYFEKKRYDDAMIWAERSLEAIWKVHSSPDLDVIRQESRILRILTATRKLPQQPDVLVKVAALAERLPNNAPEVEIFEDLRMAYEMLGNKEKSEFYKQKILSIRNSAR